MKLSLSLIFSGFFLIGISSLNFTLLQMHYLQLQSPVNLDFVFGTMPSLFSYTIRGVLYLGILSLIVGLAIYPYNGKKIN
ncbi:hypothetical protein NSQ20_25565 [Paenibacillus sp. FSL K6-1122]|uniref:hypothetical protein n=1 Tax=Paenibacillus sp. FSL K6-1122 TaxID=2954512 RepID=UPI0030EE4F6A